MARYIGIDFGTTNSAIAVCDSSGPPRLLPLPDGPNVRDTWRTVLFFEQGSGSRPQVSAGAQAIERYLDSGGDGRFIQSIKSHLASPLFSKTSILHRNYSLEDLISTYLLRMREASKEDLGDTAVVGRPVRYWGADGEEDDERAIRRMRRGLEQAGFTTVRFEHEPSAAAAKYATGIDQEELVLIADFGGGTSDYCLLRIAPDAPGQILATGGVGIGGDTFDGALIDNLVAPRLGKGSMYSDPFGGRTEIPRNLYGNLRRWHHLAFLKSRETMDLLDRIAGGADDPEGVQWFMQLIECDLGLPLHQAVEACKVSLSSELSAWLRFLESPICIEKAVQRVQFDQWLEEDLCVLDNVVKDVLERASVRADDVHRVFTTGGSSFVPAVRHRLDVLFPGRLRGGEEMTSVALGLAEKARAFFRS